MMINRTVTKAIYFVALVAGCTMADEESAQAEFLTEVIVKFSQSQPIDRDIEASIKNNGILSAGVINYFSDLSDQIGVPFTATRITSGREIILQVRVDDIFADLSRHIEGFPDVSESNIISDRTGSPQRRNELLVTFKPSSKSYEIVSANNDVSGQLSLNALELVNVLTRDVGYQVTPRMLPSGDLALLVDPTAVTSELVDKLQQHDDVEYAQPNYILTF